MYVSLCVCLPVRLCVCLCVSVHVGEMDAEWRVSILSITWMVTVGQTADISVY